MTNKETPKEASERLYPIKNTGSMFMPSRDEVNNSYKQEGFIEGVKWQQERTFNTEKTNKQTAVDWLVEQLARKHNEFQALIFYYDHKEEIEQAKQIEKANIIRARVNGDEHHTFNSQMREEYAEDYYKENYGE